MYKKEACTQTSVDKTCRFHVEVQGQVVQGHLVSGGQVQGEELGRVGRRPRLKYGVMNSYRHFGWPMTINRDRSGIVSGVVDDSEIHQGSKFVVVDAI